MNEKWRKCISFSEYLRSDIFDGAKDEENCVEDGEAEQQPVEAVF